MLLTRSIAVALVLAACGSDDGEPAAVVPATRADTTALVTTSPELDPVRLTVVAGRVDAPAATGTASLVCGPDGATGTAWLAAAPSEACAALADPAMRDALGDEPEGACTQEYGGDQVARITGTIDGEVVEAGLSRRDGCAIARWDRLAPLLPSLDA